MMNSSSFGNGGRRGLACLAGIALELSLAAAGFERQPNSTLSLPPEPYQYSAADAFPGLRFSQAVAFASPPGETNRLFIVEKVGRIQMITNLANPRKTLFLDISSQLNPLSEGGLLGLAFHPGYETNRFFFVFYTSDTSQGGETRYDRLARFETSPSNPNQALAGSEMPLITQFDRAINHNGGDLHFGPDGYLYVSLGDEGVGGDFYQNSQRIDKNFFSAILRIDVDRKPGSLPSNPHPSNTNNPTATINYAIPPDNPFVGTTNFLGVAVNPAQVRTEFWAIGLRNPWRMSYDRGSGFWYCGDVGQNAREEIDILVKGGNFGWSYREGTLPYYGTPPPGTTLIEPILDYSRGSGALQGNCVIGGVVYRGAKIPQLSGEYIFGDNYSGNIWAMHYDGTNASRFRRLTSVTHVCAFGIDPASQDILMGVSEANALIYRLSFSNAASASFPATLAETGAFVDLASLAAQPGIVPYAVNVPFWSDHAGKTRWFSVPDTNQFIGFSSNANWSFPTGTVWIKHFDLELTNGVPESVRRLETRFLVRNYEGVYGITYRWDDSQTNAFLVSEDGLDEAFPINNGGIIRTQVWRYPARTECTGCHTPSSGLALGFNTFQMHRDFLYGTTSTNQILALAAMGYFSNSVMTVAGLPALSPATNQNASVESRVQSYLAANCVQCHQPDGTAPGLWDARFTTSLSEAGLINGPLADPQGNPASRVIRPGSLADSMLFQRISQFGPLHMPPLATSELNQQAIDLLALWITNDLARITIGLRGTNLVYTEGDGQVVLDATASIMLPALASLAGGTLRVEFMENGQAEDRLAVRQTGNGPGEIGVAQNVIRFGGIDIGTVIGGTSGDDPLVISFNTNVTAAAAEALLRNVTYGNASTTPSSELRTLSLRASDPTTLVTGAASLAISVQGRPELPVINWPPLQDIVYGTALTLSQFNPMANVPGNFAFNPPLGELLNAGSNLLLRATFTPVDTTNYLMLSVSNQLTVQPANLTIRAQDKTKIEGQPNPSLTASYIGFVNGEGPTNLDVPVVLVTTATGQSPPGSYPIVASGAEAMNYQISFVNGVLRIEPNVRLGSISLGNDGLMRIQFSGLSNRVYRVEASSDLMAWETVDSVQVGTDGQGEFSQAQGALAGSTKRFYRFAWP